MSVNPPTNRLIGSMPKIGIRPTTDGCRKGMREEKIFRPGSWNACGTADLESADFRACHNFGPLYG